jgi:hypothetical protein
MNNQIVAFIRVNEKEHFYAVEAKYLAFIPRENEYIALNDKSYEVSYVLHTFVKNKGVNDNFVYVYVKDLKSNS